MKKVFLKPGEVYLSVEGGIVTTILGSCVSVCIFDRKLCYGVINHVVLPHSEISSQAKRLHQMQFADTATIELLKFMKNNGSNHKDLDVKILGGASNITLFNESNESNIGSKNIQAVQEILSKYKLNISAKVIGGNLGMKLAFNTKNGEIKYKTLKKKNHDSEKRVKVLIIDDSKPIRSLLRKIVEKDSKLQVIGEAEHPFEAMSICEKITPDVITLDLNMPKMDGVTYLKKYMSEKPIPTIIITDYSLKNSGPVFESLESGAIDYIKKPAMKNLEVEGIKIRSKIKMAAQANLRSFSNNSVASITQPKVNYSHISGDLILLGASTGGTIALTKLLLSFPAHIPPTLVVQHIPPVFSKAFADRLNAQLPFNVKEATNGDLLENDFVYVAPGGIHMQVKEREGKRYICLVDSEPVNQFKPSVDILFQSACKLTDSRITSALLTGMGSDGASGLLQLKNSGAFTIAQDESSSVVFGMPRAAIDLGAVCKVSELSDIGRQIFLSLDIKRKRYLMVSP